jgi:glucokinase
MAISGTREAHLNCAAGIDIGGTKILLYVSDGEGNMIEKRKLPLPDAHSPEELFSSIAALLDDSLASAGLDHSSLKGIGIGLPGVVDPLSGTARNCTALGWGEVDVRGGIQRYMDCPVNVDNDVKLAALGEGWIGAAKGIDDFFMIAIGTGIGSAFVSAGNLVRGRNFASGEIGYLIQHDSFDDDFKQDYSRFGWLESTASGTAITDAAREALSRCGKPTLLIDRFGATAETARAEHVFQGTS